MILENGNNLYIFEGAVENFSNYLLNIAIEEYKRYGNSGVVITSHQSIELEELLKKYTFLSICNSKVPNLLKPFYKEKDTILNTILSIIFSQYFYRKRAIFLLKKYKPKIIYIQKGNYGEIPYLNYYSKILRIKTIALQSSYCSFGLYELLNYYIYKSKSKNFFHLIFLIVFYKFIKYYNIFCKFLFGIRHFDEINNRGFVDLFFVDSDKFKLNYSKKIKNINTLKSVGVPEDDILYYYYKKNEPKNEILIILSNGPALWINSTKKEYLKKLNNLIQYLIINNIKFLVKLHPSDSYENYSSILNFNNFVTYEKNIYKLITLSKYIISNGGSSTRYASLIGKKSAIYSLDNIISINSSLFFDTPLFNNPDDIIKYLYGNTIYDASVKIDGNAINRILGIIHDK